MSLSTVKYCVVSVIHSRQWSN